MKKLFAVLLSAILLASMFFAGPASNATAKEDTVLKFDKMVGLPSGMTSTKAPIRGINGGGLPWTLSYGSGELTASGHLEVEVEGLVFAAGPNTGKNTITTFKAIVSCLDANGAAVNVTTEAFPATVGDASDGGGNAEFEGDLNLPQPCIAPLIFVTSPGGAWFATVGN